MTFTAIFSISILLNYSGQEKKFTEYCFLPQEDNLFENPENWTPSYPGSFIEEDKHIILQGMAYVTNYDINIAGKLSLLPDATLYSFKGNLKILPSGIIINRGELMVNQLESYGEIQNYAAGKVDVLELNVYSEAIFDNLHGANVSVATDFINWGTFNNYGTCKVKHNFKNNAEFNHMVYGEIYFRGAKAFLKSSVDKHPSIVPVQ